MTNFISHQRTYCLYCNYPQSTCVCNAVAIVNTAVHIDILQHPSEVKNAKNSARLIPLCLSSCRIWIGEQTTDFMKLQQELANCSALTYVLYPSEAANSINTLAIQTRSMRKVRLILLDGTWKKAYKLWQLNPWLHHYTQLCIEGKTSQYVIRKAPSADCLSTLEAAATCLEYLDGADCSPLYACFDLMQKPFLARRTTRNITRSE